MSYDGAAFSQHSVLSPPLLAAIDSQHTFGAYDASSTSRASNHRASVDATSASQDQPSISSHHRRNRSRASSVASANHVGASCSTQQNGHSNGNRKVRRAHNGQSAHSRSASRSGPVSTSGRSMTLAGSQDSRPLSNALRNRSTPHLDGLRSLSSSQEHTYTSPISALTAPSSPLLSAATSIALAMSPVAQATAMADHLMPSDWALDNSAPTSPQLSRNTSDYFDPALLAQLQSQNRSSHAELRANGVPDPSPPIDTVFGRLSPHPPHAARSASQSEWAHHAAQMQQTAQLLGLQRLFASRSTPHLPDLDSAFVAHEFEPPPPYAPRASALETELERAADLGGPSPNADASRRNNLSSSSSATTVLNASTSSNDPPLPPPISIPAGAGGRAVSGPSSATGLVRPGLRARSSSRGSRSGPPSPSASFYGRRGLTSLSPFPAGLEMTPNVQYTPHFSSTPASPGIAPDSDGEDDMDGALSFSSARSRQRRHERSHSIASTDNVARNEPAVGPISASLPGPSSQAQTISTRSRRSGSGGSARQLLRPRTPINSTVSAAPQPNGSALASATDASNQRSVHHRTEASEPSRAGATHGAEQSGSRVLHHDANITDTDSPSSPRSPMSESTQPESPRSTDDFANSPRRGLSINLADFSFENSSQHASEAKFTDNEASSDDEEFPFVLKLLLHPLRILAAVPGCIGTFWLARNAWVLATEHGHLLSPGQMLIAADGSSRFFSADLSDQAVTDAFRFGRRQPGSLDFAVACLWSMSTAYHALSFTTLLLRRWLLYYSILPSLIRLVALQAICWPLVRLTVHIFGADQPLGAWVVIGTTTALSDVVSRWVTSNIADAPLDDELDEEEEQEEAENEALGYLSDTRFATSPPRSGVAEPLYADQHPMRAAGGQPLAADSDWDPRSGDESDAIAAASLLASERERQRKQRRGGQGTRFWRAVIGGPSFAASSRRKKAKSTRSHLSGATTEAEMEAESDWPGYGTDRTVLGGTLPSRSEGLRRRFAPLTPRTGSAGARPSVFGRRPVLPPFPFRPSTYRQGHTRFVYRGGVWKRERTSSRRNFHWEVAVWRNVVPIAVLAYLSMWILIFDAMRIGS